MIQFDIDVQRQIIALGLDDFSPNAMLPHMHGGQFGGTPSEWRKSVVLLTCGMLAARLISSIPGLENYHEKNSDEIRALLQQADLKNDGDADLVWDVLHFCGSEKLLELLRKLELNNWEAMDAGLSQPLGKALAELNAVQF